MIRFSLGCALAVGFALASEARAAPLAPMAAPSRTAAASPGVGTIGPFSPDAGLGLRLDERPTSVTPFSASTEPARTGTVAAARPSVLEDLALEQGLAARLGAGAPTPELRAVWPAIRTAYQNRFGRPLWREDGRWTEAAKAARARLARAAEDALDLSALALPSLDEGSAAAVADQDVALSAAIVAYARQASGARVDPARLSRLVTARPKIPEAGDILSAVGAAGAGAGERLAAFNPPSPQYRALRDKLAELRQAAAPPVARLRIPAGPALKVGMRDARVKLVRARFGMGAAPVGETDAVYDTQVAEAVAGFQRANGLAPSGVLTARTALLLSGGDARRPEHLVVANMERWRWMGRDLGPNRIEVNIPDFSLALMRDDVVVHRARVIVGKPDSPTPVFSNAMKFIVVNPSWHIPPGILKNEILPKLAEDPGYAQRLGYEVTAKDGQISLRQPPGEKNALGRIKFMFPNEHSVYLHDTPNRNLFSASRRAFSHGCVRVDDPMALAAGVLGGSWTEARIKGLVGKGERTINLPQPLPIQLGYFTAGVDAEGRLQTREDVYGYDAPLIRALALKD